MDHKLQKRKLNDTDTGIKKKKKEKEHINGNVRVADKVTDINMVNGNSTTNDSKVKKKRKKKDITNSFTNGINCNKSTSELNGEALEEPEQNIQTKRLKSYKEIDNKDEEDHKEEGDTSNQTGQLDGKSLRQSFNSTSGLDTLRKFVKICNENKERDLAAEYLNAGGSILEVLRLLDTMDKKGIGAATIVFSAIRILLIKILAEYPQHQSSAEGACRHVINSHLSLVHSMLSVQSNVKQRKVILQLLAAIVSLGGNLPRELLNHLSIPLEVVKSLVKHTKPGDTQNIRNCFIHFILAFLIEGSVPIIRALLDKRELLSSIFPDLMYDSKDIVALILTTLKSYIVQNPNVSKTMKLQIFSTSVIQNLVCLYNWKGPNNWPKLKNQNTVPSSQHLEDKEVVTKIVHDFLILLLTTHRYGIIFHDRLLGTSHVKHNHMVNTILQSLDRPWEHEKPSDLVIKIMSACPDLIKTQFTLLESYIDPRVSQKWIAAMKFVREIIQSVDVKTCIKTCSLELNPIQLANAMISLTIPTSVMKQAIMPSLTHPNIIVRHEAVLTVTSMFNQIQNYLLFINTVYKEDSDSFTFKNIVTEFMIKNMPNLNTILKVWSCVFMSDSIEGSTNEKESIPEPTKHEHLIAVLNLLYMYNEVCPKFLDTLPDVQPDTFLKVLDNLDDTTINDFTVIKVKAIQFLVILYPNEFLPSKKIFKVALSFLISVLNEEASSTVSCAKITMKTLLSSTGMFEGCNDHLDIWINGLTNLDDRKKVTKWFIHIMKEAVEDIELYVNKVIEAEEIINQEVVHVGRVENIFDELINRSNVNEDVETTILHMQRFTSVSPVLCCMLHKTNKDVHPSILSYLSYVLIHTLHYQVTPQCLIYLTKDIQRLPAKEYLLSWLDDNQPAHIKKIFPSMTLMCKLSSIFLSDTKLQITEIFSGNNTVVLPYNGENVTIHHSLSTYEIIYLFKMATFYLAQFVKRGVLTEIQHDNYKTFLISLLYIAQDSPDNFVLVEECAKTIFMHPIILHYFSPLHQKSAHILRNMITFLIVDVCSVVSRSYKKSKARDLFLHFKNKFVAQLCKLTDKQQKGEKIKNVETVITLLSVLQPSAKDVVRLLKKLVKLENTMLISNDGTNLSIYGYVIPKLLNIVNNNDMNYERSVFFELDVEFIRCLCLHLFFLKSNSINDFEMWETALHGYLSKFSFNIAGIDTSIFTSLLRTKVTDSTVKLISFLISKNIKFIPAFTECIMKSRYIKEGKIVLPVIASNLKFKWNLEFLQNLRKHYETDILTYLCNPKDAKPWIEENITAIRYLIKNTFDFETCNRTCNKILQIGDKLDMVSINYIKLLESVYNKCADSRTESENLITNLIQVLLHIITLTLKKESKNVEKLNTLSDALMEAVKRLKKENEDFVYERLNNNHSWAQFTRFSLKLGLKVPKNNEKSVPILKTLSSLCDIAYKRDSSNEYVKTLFEMATSHSEFINIMLGSSGTKRDLIELLWILMKKNKTVMASAHIPVYFAAYNATLNEADQFILLILQYYESNDINIYEYRPYVWGNAAATHYSVKGETDTNLWRQPSITQVLNLFEEDVVNNTIRNYPVDRALKCNELNKANDVYDPAFYLPLLCFLLSENNVVSCHKVAQSGALALTLVACSSKHSDVRMIAYTIIARYYTHLEASRSKAKLLWMRLMDALRYGIISQQVALSDVRINSLVSTFLARTSLIATQPLHPLYSALQTFLMAKPALDINTIPELLQLYHSSDVQHKAHRYWILENIRDSMKTETELDVAFKCVLFKMLLDFYTCTLSDSNTKKLVLEVIDATLKITKACVLLIEGHGLLPWLLEVARNAYKQKAQHIELIVKIMDKILNNVLNMKGDVAHYKLMLLNVALCLKSHLPRDIRVSIFTLYIDILQKLLLSKQMKVIVTKEHIIEILDFSKKMLDDIEEYEDMLRFGCEFVTNVHSLNNDDEVEVAKNSLRTLVWTWCVHEEK